MGSRIQDHENENSCSRLPRDRDGAALLVRGCDRPMEKGASRGAYATSKGVYAPPECCSTAM